jgi:hypothetical protein
MGKQNSVIHSSQTAFPYEPGIACTPPNWPAISGLGLSPDQVRTRNLGVGGSDANTILSGDAARVRRLWLEKRGEVEPPDLSNNLPVALGSWTESFNRQWFEKISGHPVSMLGVSLSSPNYAWRRCTLDGFIEQTSAIWEGKHTSGFGRPEEILERYMPQLQHNMAVAGVERAVLSVLFGNHKFEFFEIAADWLYQIDLLQAEAEFWECVTTGREPTPAPAPAPPKPVGIREICLEHSNFWASAAADWLENRQAAKIHAAACTSLKELVEPDVARAYGHGIEAKRSKSGAISIRELAQ